MNGDDENAGYVDMATFGRLVVGPLSVDKKCLVNPLTYDPARPHRISDQAG